MIPSAQNSVWLIVGAQNYELLFFLLKSSRDVKDETKRQGNQEMGDQLRPPSLTLQQFQGKAGVQMSLSSWDFALDSLAPLRVLVTQGQACLGVCPRCHEPPGQGWALSETPGTLLANFFRGLPLVVLPLPPRSLSLSLFPRSFCSFPTSSGVPRWTLPPFDGGAASRQGWGWGRAAWEEGVRLAGGGNQKTPHQRREGAIS